MRSRFTKIAAGITAGAILCTSVIGVSVGAEGQYKVTYTTNKYTADKISHPDNDLMTADGIVDFVNGGITVDPGSAAGDRGQSYSLAMESYGDWVYVGTTAELLLDYIKDVSGEQFEANKAFLEVIYKDALYTEEDGSAASDSVLAKINIKTGETKIVMSDADEGVSDLSFTNAAKLNDKLYFSGSVNGMPGVCEIDPATDTFKTVYSESKTDLPPISGIITHNNKLVISGLNYDGSYIAISEDPSAGQDSFKVIGNESAFGLTAMYSIYGGGIWDMVSFDGDIYASVCAESGREDAVWSYAIVAGSENADGTYTWKQVIGDTSKGASYTFGINPERTQAACAGLYVYDDCLYIGDYCAAPLGLTNILVGQDFRPMKDIFAQSANLYRLDKNGKLDLIVGDADSVFPDGSLSGLGSGFGRRENLYIWKMFMYGGKLYVGTFDSSSLLKPATLFPTDYMSELSFENIASQIEYVQALLGILLGDVQLPEINIESSINELIAYIQQQLDGLTVIDPEVLAQIAQKLEQLQALLEDNYAPYAQKIKELTEQLTVAVEQGDEEKIQEIYAELVKVYTDLMEQIKKDIKDQTGIDIDEINVQEQIQQLVALIENYLAEANKTANEQAYKASAEAVTAIAENLQKLVDDGTLSENYKDSADALLAVSALLNAAVESGDYETAGAILDELDPILTEIAQNLIADYISGVIQDGDNELIDYKELIELIKLLTDPDTNIEDIDSEELKQYIEQITAAAEQLSEVLAKEEYAEYVDTLTEKAALMMAALDAGDYETLETLISEAAPVLTELLLKLYLNGDIDIITPEDELTEEEPADGTEEDSDGDAEMTINDNAGGESADTTLEDLLAQIMELDIFGTITASDEYKQIVAMAEDIAAQIQEAAQNPISLVPEKYMPYAEKLRDIAQDIKKAGEANDLEKLEGLYTELAQTCTELLLAISKDVDLPEIDPEDLQTILDFLSNPEITLDENMLAKLAEYQEYLHKIAQAASGIPAAIEAGDYAKLEELYAEMIAYYAELMQVLYADAAQVTNAAISELYDALIQALEAKLGELIGEENAANVMALIRSLIVIGNAQPGFDLYVTDDGVTFEEITLNGFGDPYNYGPSVATVTDLGAVIGTANPFYGTQVWLLNETNPDHKHTVVKHEKVEPTCTEDGETEHYYCTKCLKIFADEACTKELTKEDIVIPALGHDPELQNVKEATETEDGYSGDLICKRCGLLIEEGHVIPAGSENPPTGGSLPASAAAAAIIALGCMAAVQIKKRK